MNFISRTPLRVSLFGGGSDYKEYYAENGGAVLGGSIDKYIFTTCLDLPNFVENKYKLSYRKTEEVVSYRDFDHPVVKAVLSELNWDRPINLATMAELPGGTGLGSSSAFTVGLIDLLNRINGVALSPLELVRQAYRIEHDVLGEDVGIQDHLHAAFGGFSMYHLLGDKVQVEPIGLSGDLQSQLNEELFLVYTGGSRHASAIAKTQVEGMKSKRNHSQLREMVAMAHLGRDVLSSRKPPADIMSELAVLLNESWKLKMSLSGDISNDHVHGMYQKGLQLGARAGKLCGAGGSGFLLFMVPKEVQIEFVANFGSDILVKFQFVSQGTHVSSLV